MTRCDTEIDGPAKFLLWAIDATGSQDKLFRSSPQTKPVLRLLPREPRKAGPSVEDSAANDPFIPCLLFVISR